MGHTPPGNRTAWGHSGFHSWVTLGDSWAGSAWGDGAIRNGSGSRIPGLLLPAVWSRPYFYQHTVRLGRLVSLHWHPAKRQETANNPPPPLCWGRGSQKTKVWYLPSKSSGLMGERHVTNLSAALKLCPKGLQQRGKSNSFSVTSVRSHICHSRGGGGQHGQSGALGAQSGRVTHPRSSGLRKAELRARMGQWVKY